MPSSSGSLQINLTWSGWIQQVIIVNWKMRKCEAKTVNSREDAISLERRYFWRFGGGGRGLINTACLDRRILFSFHQASRWRDEFQQVLQRWIIFFYGNRICNENRELLLFNHVPVSLIGLKCLPEILHYLSCSRWVTVSSRPQWLLRHETTASGIYCSVVV